MHIGNFEGKAPLGKTLRCSVKEKGARTPRKEEWDREKGKK